MKFIPAALTDKVARQLLTVSKHSPRILFGAGIVGVVGGTILACRATLKLEETLDDFKHEVDMVKEDEGLSPAEHRKDLAYVYAKNTTKLVKLYGPAVLIGGGGLVCLTTSHVTLNRRNAGLTAAYAALQTTFDRYSTRVREELGEERESEIRRGVVKTVGVDEKGKKTTVVSVDPKAASVYSRCFDESSSCWSRFPDENRHFVMSQQIYANHQLNAKGHLFLNELYDALGMDRTPEGQVVGWLINDDPTREADMYIDFGLQRPESARFMQGWEPSVWLDFNVDGPILDLI